MGDIIANENEFSTVGTFGSLEGEEKDHHSTFILTGGPIHDLQRGRFIIIANQNHFLNHKTIN